MPTRSKKTLWIFSLSSFLNDLGSDMIASVWPIFLTEVLRAPLAAVGFIDGLGDMIVSLSKAWSGYLSDRIGKKKPFIWIGYLFGGLSRIGYAFSQAWTGLIPFRILDRMGKIRSSPRDAMLTDLMHEQIRGRSFGFLQMFDNLGALAGVIIALYLVQIIPLRQLFMLAALPSFFGAILVLVYIREKTPDKPPTLPRVFALGKTDTRFRLFLAINALFSIGFFSYSFLLLYAKHYGAPITVLPFLYLIYVFAAALASWYFGRLSDTVGARRILVIGYVLWLMVCVLFFIKPGFWLMAGAFVLYGANKGILDTTQKTYVSFLAPADLRASYFGTFEMVVGIVALPASLIAGLLWQYVGHLSPLIFSTITSGLAVILLILHRARYGR